jgi:hypothetical protein
MATKGKVLVLVSIGRGLPLKNGKVYAGAGYYLNELTVPVRALMKEGYEITFGGWATFAGAIIAEAAPPLLVLQRWATMRPVSRGFDFSGP